MELQYHQSVTSNESMEIISIGPAIDQLLKAHRHILNSTCFQVKEHTATHRGRLPEKSNLSLIKHLPVYRK